MADGAWELRIHGVSNTPPASILHSWGDRVGPPDQPEPLRLVAGDQTTGFYRRVRSGPDPDEVEAFSWGQLTSGPRGGGNGVVKDIRRAAWSLLLPFALVNLALWARPALSPQPGDRGSARVLAWFVRLMALSLTVTMAIAAAGIGMDLLAWQCRADCRRTPPGLGWLGSQWLATGGRLVVIGALVPFGLVCGLVWLAGKTFQYEAVTATATMGDVRARHPLADRQFWAGSSQVRTLRRLHTIVALGVIAHLMAASAWAAPGADGWVVPVGLTVSISAVAMAGCICVALLGRKEISQRHEGENSFWVRGRSLVGRWWDALLWYVLPGVVVLAAVVVAAYGPGPYAGRALRLPGYEATLSLLFLAQFTLLVALLVTNQVAAVGARSGAGRHPDDPAWRGLGTTLLAGSGWILAMLYSAAMLFGVAWWLNGGSAATDHRTAFVPPSLQWAALGLALAVVVVAVSAVLAVSKLDRLRKDQTATVVAGLPNATAHQEVAAALAGHWRALHLLSGYHALTRVGWLACAGFAISVAAAVVGSFKLVAFLPGSAPWVRWMANPWQPGVSPPAGMRAVDATLTVVSTSGGVIAVAVMLGLAALIGAAYRSPRVRRVVGIVWDIATFWPRGAHPFAPPCYAERAVPQLVTRICGRSAVPVILAGHSQGSLLAAACVFQLPPQRRRSVYLLTFGTQMTRLYGRVFPAFFGVRGREELALALSDRDPSLPTVPGAPAGVDPDVEGFTGADLSSVRWRNLWRTTDPLGWPIGRWDETAPGPGPSPSDPSDPSDLLGPRIDVQVVDPIGFAPEPPGEVLDPPVRQHSDYPLSKEYAEGVAAAASVLHGARR